MLPHFTRALEIEAHADLNLAGSQRRVRAAKEGRCHDSAVIPEIRVVQKILNVHEDRCVGAGLLFAAALFRFDVSKSAARLATKAALAAPCGSETGVSRCCN